MQWLWPKLIRQELDDLKERFNNHIVRFDKAKKLPSGMSPNVAFALHEKYGAENLLQPVDRAIAQNLMEQMGGEDLVRFVTDEYAARAQAAFDALEIGSLTLQNVWHVFEAMLPRLYSM